MGFYAREAAREPDEIQALSLPFTWVPGFLWLLFGVRQFWKTRKVQRPKPWMRPATLNQNTAAQRFRVLGSHDVDARVVACSSLSGSKYIYSTV